MPTIDILRQTQIKSSFRVEQIRGMFDFDKQSVEQRWTGDLPIEEREWQIGLIVGASGSGKTTLAKELFANYMHHTTFEWSNDAAAIDSFPPEHSTKDIVRMFNAVGFSSPPHWLKPFAHLSNGQKFRVELARCLLMNKSGLVFDEFTSIVDRDVAKICCAAISKTLRRKNAPPFVAVSCHYDIIDWLDPDWVFDVSTMRFEWRLRRRFPEIKLDIFKVHHSEWRIFGQHHYLNTELHKAAQCFEARWNGKPVAFCSVMHFPHPHAKNIKQEHRTVVLPDFQGVGIGNRLSEYVAQYFTEKGFRFISTTSNPAMINHRQKSPKWITTRFGKTPAGSEGKATGMKKARSCKRNTASFEFAP